MMILFYSVVIAITVAIVFVLRLVFPIIFSVLSLFPEWMVSLLLVICSSFTAMAIYPNHGDWKNSAIYFVVFIVVSVIWLTIVLKKIIPKNLVLKVASYFSIGLLAFLGSVFLGILWWPMNFLFIVAYLFLFSVCWWLVTKLREGY